MNTIVLVFALVDLYLVQISISSCSVLPPHIAAEQTTDYYWRDYVGIIPNDAVQGGTDKAGNPTYVGQAYIRNFELLPVTIFPGCMFANTTAHGAEITTDKNIKILCAKDLENFEWVITKNEETHLLINCHLVMGGSEIGHTLNIGRVKHDGRIVIGKIFSYPLENRGLAIPYNGKPIVFLSYEILTYKCQKNTIKTAIIGLEVDIDVRSGQ